MKNLVKKAFLDTEDGQIFYKIAGEGKPLLLLHRSPQSSDEFRKLIPLLAANHRVIAMDMMGFGNSDKPPRIYAVADYAKTVIALLDELGITTTNILGNHTGAYVAAEVAAAYPERVEKLILSNVDKFSDQEKDTILNSYAEKFQIKADGGHLLPRWLVYSKYASSPEFNHRCFLEELKCHGHPAYGPLAVVDYLSCLDARFRLIKCPTLVLSGTEDIKELERLGLATAENRRLISQLIPHGKITEILGGTVCMMNQMAEEISQVVLEFLNAVDIQ
ncbi:MAG: alpha/beta hydrolase [Nodularia sp. (in: Bacteria)]|nr:MAG: alpha/beta hydrolase [Nodularia sp. (in: cyanobacteria)]